MWMYADEDVNCTSLCLLNQVARLVSCSMPCSNSLQKYGHICTAQVFRLATVQLYVGFKIITELYRYTWANLTPSSHLNRPVIQPSHPTIRGSVSKPFILSIWVTGRWWGLPSCQGRTGWLWPGQCPSSPTNRLSGTRPHQQRRSSSVPAGTWNIFTVLLNEGSWFCSVLFCSVCTDGAVLRGCSQPM